MTTSDDLPIEPPDAAARRPVGDEIRAIFHRLGLGGRLRRTA